MSAVTVLVVLASALVCVHACYWNRECPFLLHSAKTPYDTIRGDIRDHPLPQNCKAVSIWTLNRHGNRHPVDIVTEDMKAIASLRDEIVESYKAGRSQLCAQDIENFRKWMWNETLEVSPSYLTDTGYKELYNIAKRIREKYPHLLEGSNEEYYFRPTNEQRTITSAIAFAHGLTQGTNITAAPVAARERDDVIRPYKNCDRYQQEVKTSQLLNDHLYAYYETAEFIAVQNAVQRRLGITTELNPDDIYALYEICRFDRSWNENHQSPWCAAFSVEDLVVLEYKDDVRHFYKNGYGSWVNIKLGGPALKDLYEKFDRFVTKDKGRKERKVVSYFTHDTFLEMVFCAMGVFKDDQLLQGSRRDPNRVWRTSIIAAFAANIIAVLNSCEEPDKHSYRVQLFINEKKTEVCPAEGCTWEQFQDKFEPFTSSNLDFCSMNYRRPQYKRVQHAARKSMPHNKSIHSAFTRCWMKLNKKNRAKITYRKKTYPSLST